MFDKFSRIFECGAVLTCTSIWGKEGKLNIWRKKEESLRDSRNRLKKEILQFLTSYSYFRAACYLHHPGAVPRVTGVIFWISAVPTFVGRAACPCAPSFRDFPRHSCYGLIASFPGPCVSSGGRLPEALFMVFLLDSEDASGFWIPANFGESSWQNSGKIWAKASKIWQNYLN